MTALGMLRVPAFRVFLLAYATSLFGSHMASVALVFAVLESGGTASDVGVVIAARIVPIIVFLLIGGVLSDRLPRRTMMISADVLRTVSQGGIALLFVAGEPGLAPVLVLAALTGVGEALFMPALNGIIPSLAPRTGLQDANTLLSVTRSTAAVAGPALAGVLVAAFGATTVLVIDTGCYALSVLALLFLRVPGTPADGGETFLHQLRAGWRYFRSITWLWTLTLHGALFNCLVWAPYLVLGPVAADRYYDGAFAWGLMMGGFGVGAVVTGILLLGRRPRRPLVVMTCAAFAWAAPLLGIVTGAGLVLVALGAAAAGAAAACGETLLNTTIQQQVPGHSLSRVMSYTTLGAFALGPLGLVLAGPAAEATSLRTVLAVGVGWQVLACAALLCLPAIRAVRGDQHPAPSASPVAGG
jgi:MFS family permease